MIAQNVADILRDHVELAVEGIDRMYLSCRYRHDKYCTKPLRGSSLRRGPRDRRLLPAFLKSFVAIASSRCGLQRPLDLIVAR
jgi:hypothetical protein